MVVLGQAQTPTKSLPQLKLEMDEAKTAWDLAKDKVKQITVAIDSLIKELKKTGKPEAVAKANNAEINKKQVMQAVEKVHTLKKPEQITEAAIQKATNAVKTVQTNSSGKGTAKGSKPTNKLPKAPDGWSRTITPLPGGGKRAVYKDANGKERFAQK